MSAREKALAHFLDAYAHGGTSPPDGGDEETRQTVDRLFQMSGRVTAPAAFVHELEDTLMNNHRLAALDSMPSHHVPVSPSRRDRAWSRPARAAGRLPQIAIAAVFVLVLGAAFGPWTRLGPAPNAPLAAIVAPSVGVYPPASDCLYKNLATATQHAANPPDPSLPLLNGIPVVLRYPPGQTAYPEYLFPESALPAGPAPDAATQAAIRQAVQREVACRNAGALYWRITLAGFGNIAIPTAAVAMPASPGSPGASAGITPIPVPDLTRVSVLGDGRVFVLLSADLFGRGLKSWMIFGDYQGEWLVDRSGQSAADAWVASEYFGEITMTPTIHLNDTYLWPLQLKTRANQPPAGSNLILPPINVKVINDGAAPRTFTMPELDVRVTLQPGAQLVIPLTLAPNGYWFTEDFDPASQTQTSGYLWVID